MSSWPPLGTPVGPVPGRLARGNISLMVRPRVGRKTIYSTSFGTDDGKEILVPLITEDGRELTGDQAIEEFKRTGKHLGIFDSPETATAYAKRLSEAQGSRPPLSPAEAKRRGLLRALREFGP